MVFGILFPSPSGDSFSKLIINNSTPDLLCFRPLPEIHFLNERGRYVHNFINQFPSPSGDSFSKPYLPHPSNFDTEKSTLRGKIIFSFLPSKLYHQTGYKPRKIPVRGKIISQFFLFINFNFLYQNNILLVKIFSYSPSRNPAFIWPVDMVLPKYFPPFEK